MGWQDDPVVGAGDPELDSKGRYVVEPNVEQRRMGLRKNRFKDENLAGNVGSGLLSFPEDTGQEFRKLGMGMGLPPDVSNAMAFGGDAAATVMPVGRVGQGAKAATDVAGQPAAKWMMGQALNAKSRALTNGDAGRAIETMLAEGVNATAGGAAKLRLLIQDLKKQVGEIISASPATVDKNHVYKELSKTLDDVSKQGSGYTSDRAAVLKAWEEFKNHPLLGNRPGPGGWQAPIQTANEVKGATQKSVESAYGSLTPPTAGDKANMAIASGLRKGIEAAEPAVGPLNKSMSEYINALELIEPRAASFAKNQIAGISLAGQSPEATLLMMADKNPWLKSYVAQVLRRGEIPAGAAKIGYAGSTAMNTQ